MKLASVVALAGCILFTSVASAAPDLKPPKHHAKLGPHKHHGKKKHHPAPGKAQ
jgi:hypothetical protein